MSSRSRIFQRLLLSSLLSTFAGSFSAMAIEKEEAPDSPGGREKPAPIERSEPRLLLQPEIAKQGETVRVYLRADPTGGSDAAGGAGLASVQFHKRSYKVFPVQAENGGGEAVFRALIAVPADLEPGSYSVSCGKQVKTLKVVDGKFAVQTLRLPPGKDNFNASPGEEEAVNAAKASLSPKQYWEGPFLRPNAARVSSGFGLRRRVNGKLLKDYFHSGLDFAGAAGSPVLATQAGKVVLARTGWKLHGNTICIDHGQGVLSFYIHLSRLFAKEGEFVRAGQKIGAVGSSGRANGPHLHFSLYVNNDATNPWSWFAADWLKAKN